jgi:hypothetical protein
VKQAERIEILNAIREAENALLDYVERLEIQGGMMNYGRLVIRKLQHAAIVTLKAK